MFFCVAKLVSVILTTEVSKFGKNYFLRNTYAYAFLYVSIVHVAQRRLGLKCT